MEIRKKRHLGVASLDDAQEAAKEEGPHELRAVVEQLERYRSQEQPEHRAPARPRLWHVKTLKSRTAGRMD